MKSTNLKLVSILCVALIVPLTGCHIDMWRQHKAHSQGESEFYLDKQDSRPIVAHTVPRNPFSVPVDGKLQAPNSLRVDNPFYSGLENGKLVSVVPESAKAYFKGDFAKMMHVGHERFNIFCSPCHGRLGNGQGMIAKRGFNLVRKPASYHSDRLRNLPDGHIFDVITNGFGTMYSYASRTTPEERWAIVAYVRALQLSQNAKVTDVPQDKLGDLEKPLSAFEEHVEEEEAKK